MWRGGIVHICMTNTAASFESEILSAAAHALLGEMRALTEGGGVYANPRQDSALDVLLDELIHENLVEPNPADGEGWVAADPELRS